MRPILFLAAAAFAAQAQTAKQQITASLDAKFTSYRNIANQIWNLAEVGYQETQSSALLQSELTKAGFRVRAGVAGMPTAFVAEYGSG
jgi:aminobenzoyl-glutamate utilization protein B